MPFLFSLQAVLRCRESFEQRERQRLQMITHEVVKTQQQREDAKLERTNALDEMQKKLQQGMAAVEMQFELKTDRARIRRIAALSDHLTKLEDLRRRQLEMFHKAQQQRKILENLRERQFAAYQLIQARREQQQMDDRFLITRAYKLPASNYGPMNGYSCLPEGAFPGVGIHPQGGGERMNKGRQKAGLGRN